MLLDRWSNRIRIFLITMVHGTGAENTLMPMRETELLEELDAKMAEDLSGKFVQILKDSGTRAEALCALRTLLSKALKDGEKRETILIKMEELRKPAVN